MKPLFLFPIPRKKKEMRWIIRKEREDFEKRRRNITFFTWFQPATLFVNFGSSVGSSWFHGYWLLKSNSNVRTPTK